MAKAEAKTRESVRDRESALRKTSALLRSLSLVVCGTTFLALCLGIGPYVTHAVPPDGRGLAALLSAVAILACGVVDYRRRQADLDFEALSDGFQSEMSESLMGTGGEGQGSVLEYRERSARLRTTLREFTSASDMPLVPGRFGPAAYVALNLVLVVALTLLNLSHRWG